MRQRRSTVGVRHDAGSAAIFRAVFRLTSISDLYGPEKAVEWARTLLDDPQLLTAFARPRTFPAVREAPALRRRAGC